MEMRAARPMPWKWIGLALIVVAVAIVTYHPHRNVVTGSSDPFPVHADEYVHWGFADAMARDGTVSFDDPFTGTSADRADSVDAHERGFQAYLAVFHLTTGIDWISIMTTLPTVVAVFATLAIFLAAERWGAGLAAALWFLAVPTSLRFLGPAWAVPSSFALPFIAFAIWIVFGELAAGALGALLIVCFALWTIHTMAGAIVTLIALLAGALLLRLTPARAIALLAITAGPALVAHAQIEQLFGEGARIPTLPSSVSSIRIAGALLYGVAAVGVFLMASSNDRKERAAGTTLGALLLALGFIVVYRMTEDIDLFRAYDRATLMIAFLATFAAGVGLTRVVAWVLRTTRATRWRALGTAAAVALVLVQVAGVAQAARSTMEQPYYVSMTTAQYEAYVEAAEELGPEHRRAIVGGGPTMPFTIVTGIPTLYVRSPETFSEPAFVVEFFRKGADDTRFLVETGTTVVVSPTGVRNPDLHPVAPGVYALRDDYVARMYGG